MSSSGAPAFAIRGHGLAKRYRIGTGDRYETLRDTITRRFGRLGRGTSDRDGAQHVWALRDASFDVRRGEVLGLIGPNGAGKTTLLKILARITAPTDGTAEIVGRLGSLLEVGTGFHPELTGRENIQLAGAILGMTRPEILRKFDEIVAFAEVERFVDTPVKRYSTGMYLRLAFAVAAHLEPEILLVDEVLAVGDAAFQRKCLGKMREVAGVGRTVLFVSHNMGAVQQLCPRTIWLDGGRIVRDGPTAEVIRAYLTASDQRTTGAVTALQADLRKESQVREVRILDARGEPTERLSCDETVTIELVYEVRQPLSGLYGVAQVSRRDGTPVLVSYSHDHAPDPLNDLGIGQYLVRLSIPPRSLAPGDYTVHFSTGSGRLGTRVVDDAGLVGAFSLDDTATLSGNGRIGFFSTVLPWDVRHAAVDEAVVRSR